MKTRLHHSLTLLVGIAAFTLATAADAARIDGINPFEPVTAADVVPAVADQTMHLRLADGRTLTVTPWPGFLPQRFGKQAVTGERHMHPAGPIDRLSFSRAAEASPWMALGSGARRATSLIDDWQLQLSRGRWSVTDGQTRKFFGEKDSPLKPAMVKVGADRWCIYLLESSIPLQQPHVALEAQPQIEWAAIRLSRLQNRCAVQK